MSSGLSRRRVNAASGANGQDSPTISRTPSERRTIHTDGDDHKIAFDPRDLEQGEEQARQPKLTLMEEVLLLGIKDKQGYLSFWNDSISYALRGCILIELAFRGKIRMQKDVARKRFPLTDRIVELVDDKLTGEVLLDEALKMIRSSEPMSVGSWVDLMSGETWNVMKIGYQLRQVRERLAKGLVDKGVLRTEKRNFLLFDMATHPVADTGVKEGLKRRIMSLVTSQIAELDDTPYFPKHLSFRYLRTVTLVCSAYAACVLDNVFSQLSYEDRERAFSHVDELLYEFSQWPFGLRSSGQVATNLPKAITEELSNVSGDELLSIELIAAVLQVFTHLDSLF
ncbi:hypothetical protein SJAG_01516 [Schizosaccharomyces japonicus yFS275]|uniref:Vacuolar protein sorting-associated protein 74 n=1 Tax=Schizosaccharomyces japonicus (strain yFS275 / FY16936) TaxID=402676 RepID=B6JY57_SCHJY|nr:hypothetical protein SJAG_01516 [Schizosaccharomyces japonicus yFS275]EEB06475.1 hypothetical protein SJAG_01516 [Schizosaccharomyces japonicus yFS275]